MVQHVCNLWMFPLLDIRRNIHVRCYPHPAHSVFDTHLFVFITETIRICICICGYPCLNPNPIKNVKTNTILTISDPFASELDNITASVWFSIATTVWNYIWLVCFPTTNFWPTITILIYNFCITNSFHKVQILKMLSKEYTCIK